MEPDGMINRWVLLAIGLFVGCLALGIVALVRDIIINFRHLKYWSDTHHHIGCECNACELRYIAEINRNYE